MLVPLSWLKEYVDIPLSTLELAERLTLAGLEEVGITRTGDWWEPDKIVVGQVVAVAPHPNADRLVLVDVVHSMDAPQRVVTGAPNLFKFKGRSVEAGNLPVLKVAFAREGSLLVNAYSDQQPRPLTKLKKAKIRGIESRGMICSERELGLSEEHEGILLLPEDAPVGTPMQAYLSDDILEIDLTPDMARCLSLCGIAREVQALTTARLHLPADVDSAQGDDSAADYLVAEIADATLCHRFTGTLIRDVTVGPSPAWMQERLTKAGMRPINSIVDITNYVMLELGQPLHAFDYDLLVARAEGSGESHHAEPVKPTIIVRTAAPGEEIKTLDGQVRKLDESMLLITDKAGPIAIAGVMGGADTEVHEGTRNILLESATFDGINNRRTSQALRLHSEASYRFTRSIPATLNAIAARRAAHLMQQYSGGRVVPGIVDTYPLPQPEVTVYTSQSDVQRLLGLDLSLAQIREALQKLDFAVVERETVPTGAPEQATFGLAHATDEPVLEVTIPWHRLDIALPADLAEEVARVVGYDRVGETLLDTGLPPQRRNAVLETEENIRDILIGCGLQDTVNYTLTTLENHRKLLVTEERDTPLPPFIELTNALSPQRQVLRRDMMVSALENLAYNQRYAQRLAIFEIGRVYRPEDGDETLPDEDRRLCIALRGPRHPNTNENFLAPTSSLTESEAESFDFFDLKGIIETMLERLGFHESDYQFRAHPDSASFGPRCALLSLHGACLGILGELHPKVRNAFGLGNERVALAEMHIGPFVQPSWRVSQMMPISVYPPVVEDLAFMVPEDVTQSRLRDAIINGGGDLLTRVELFDIYRGEPLPIGHKSLAYRVTYQSLDHGLSEKEVNRLRQRIIRNAEKATGGQLR